VRLHWHPFSIFPRRVRVALLEKAVPCEDAIVDLPGGATRSAEFRRLNPFGQVPVLEDDGVVVYESLAILEYLEERHPSPPLLPADAAGRAHARQLMHASGDYLAGPLKRWLTRLFAPEATWDRTDQERAVGEIASHLDVLEGLLGDRAHLVGPFTLADVAYVPLVCELDVCDLGHLVGARPSVRAWIDRLRARPSVRATSFTPA
jgi:glutathione S-transferase